MLCPCVYLALIRFNLDYRLDLIRLLYFTSYTKHLYNLKYLKLFKIFKKYFFKYYKDNVFLYLKIF